MNAGMVKSPKRGPYKPGSTRYRGNRYRGLCACGKHAWAVLTQGYVTLVSPKDAVLLQKRKWYATRTKTGAVYVARGGNKGRARIDLHRAILGRAAVEETDHKNHVGTDNRRSNLRPATHSQNMSNRRYPRGISGFRGVTNTKGGRWQARVSNYSLGTFSTPEEAARARDTAAIELFGDFAILNFPGESTAVPNPTGNGAMESTPSSLQRGVFTVPEFCARNNISQLAYRQLRSQGLAPAEIRLWTRAPRLDLIRITAEAEHEWKNVRQKTIKARPHR